MSDTYKDRGVLGQKAAAFLASGKGKANGQSKDRKHKRNFRPLVDWNHMDLSFRSVCRKNRGRPMPTTRYMARFLNDPEFAQTQRACSTVTPLS